GLVLALGALVAVGVAVLPTQAAALNARNPFGHFGGFGAFGPGGKGDHGRGPHGGLTVTSVGGSTITATRRDGATVTIHTTSSTTYGRAGKTVDASAITKGERIGVRGTRNSDGSITATHIEVLLPHASGSVTAISGGTITVQGRDGASQTIHTSASTAVERAEQTASLSDIKVGDRIVAEGAQNSDGSLNAEAIYIVLPHGAGQITAISSGSITVRDPFGGTLVIHTDSSTKFESVTRGTNGPERATSKLSDLKIGDTIIAEGIRASDGSLNALVVTKVPALQGHSGKRGLGQPGSPATGV